MRRTRALDLRKQIFWIIIPSMLLAGVAHAIAALTNGAGGAKVVRIGIIYLGLVTIIYLLALLGARKLS